MSTSSTEALRPIEGWDGYLASSNGDIISMKHSKPRVIAKRVQPSGYVDAHLSSNGRSATVLVHRLIAKAFVDNPDNKPCVNHKNCIRSDNRAENLEWVTHKENSEYMCSLGRQSRHGCPGLPVVATNVKTGAVKWYRSELSTEKDGFRQACVWRCCRGRSKTHKGHTFRYATE